MADLLTALHPERRLGCAEPRSLTGYAAGLLPLLLALVACHERSQEPAKPSTRNVYVVAKNAPLRARAEARAVVIAELPIGTKLAVERVAGEWCAVRAGEAKSGFVETRFLANDEPTPSMLREQFFATPKVTWSGRTSIAWIPWRSKKSVA